MKTKEGPKGPKPKLQPSRKGTPQAPARPGPNSTQTPPTDHHLLYTTNIAEIPPATVHHHSHARPLHRSGPSPIIFEKTTLDHTSTPIDRSNFDKGKTGNNIRLSATMTKPPLCFRAGAPIPHC